MEPLKTMNPSQLSALALLIGAYRWTMDDLAMAAWGHYLAEIDAAKLRAVIDAWVRKESHAPSIADILVRVDALSGTDAETAWKWVRAQVMSAHYRDRGFTCGPRVKAAVEAAGGWRAIGQTAETDLHYRKREFIEGYTRFTQRIDAAAALTPGYPELEALNG